MANASDESSVKSESIFKMFVTISLTCCLFACPLPTTDFFTCNAVYSKIFKFFDTAEAIRAPLAWPNSKEELGFILIKTYSKLTK